MALLVTQSVSLLLEQVHVTMLVNRLSDVLTELCERKVALCQHLLQLIVSIHMPLDVANVNFYPRMLATNDFKRVDQRLDLRAPIYDIRPNHCVKGLVTQNASYCAILRKQLDTLVLALLLHLVPVNFRGKHFTSRRVVIELRNV